jgi:multiple sugar transport system permease protein
VSKPIKPRKKIRLRDNLTGWLFVLPAVLLICTFVIYPFLSAAKLSFYDIKIYDDDVFVGWDNYKIVLTNGGFWKSIQVGFQYVGILLPCQFILGFMIALLIKGRRTGAQMVKSTIYIPNLISGIITGTIFSLILTYDAGLLNKLIGLFGIEPIPFTSEMPMMSILIPGIWLGLGYVTLVLLSALNEVPAIYYEAAKLDGANSITCFFKITLPYIKNVLIYLLVTSFASNLQQYELSLTITGDLYDGATTTPNFYIYNLMTYGQRRPQAIVASLAMFVVLGATTAIIFSLMKSEKSIDS